MRSSNSSPSSGKPPGSPRSIRIDFTNANGVVLSKVISSRTKGLSEEALRTGVKMFRGNYFMMLSYSIAPKSRYPDRYGDISVIPDPSTLSVFPYDASVARVIGDLYEPETREPWQCCARNLLKKILNDAKNMGFDCVSAGELEFYLLSGKNLSPYRVKAQDGKKSGRASQLLKKNKKPKVEPFPKESIPFTGYALDMSDKPLKDIISNLTNSGINVTRFAKEGGQGQFEINLLHQRGIKAADDIMTFKQIVKAIAIRNGLVASFMPKPFENDLGSGMHLHVSLADTTSGENVFLATAPSGRRELSETCLNFVGGLLEHSPALCALTAPTFNSYKRLKPGTVSADSISFGLDDRRAAIRVPSERTKTGFDSTRVEFRIPDCACNPHLALATIIASGLDGIRRKLDPGSPLGNKEKDKEKSTKELPNSLDEALDRLREDAPFFQGVLGRELFDEFLIMKEYESSLASKVVSDWEIHSYLQAF